MFASELEEPLAQPGAAASNPVMGDLFGAHPVAPSQPPVVAASYPSPQVNNDPFADMFANDNQGSNASPANPSAGSGALSSSNQPAAAGLDTFDFGAVGNNPPTDN
jgi:hypothetical protein